MSTRRKVRDHQEAKQLLKAWSASPLSLTQIAHKHGVDGRSLLCWKRNLKFEHISATATTLRLVEIELKATTHPTRYNIHCNDVIIDIDDHFSDDTLRRILNVVRA